MHGDVEVRHQRGAWRVGLEGGPQLHAGYRTLEEALEDAWSIAARFRTPLHVGNDLGDAGAHDALRTVTV